MRQVTLLLALMIALSPATAPAQTISGSMSGSVVDQSGQVVPGATVTITHENSREQRTGFTNEVGDFAFAGLAPGPYTVRVELTGFKPLERRGNVVLGNSRLAVPRLRLEVGELAEAITVTARGETVATTTTAHQAVLDFNQMMNLNVRGSDPISLLKVLPGVTLRSSDQDSLGGSFATPVPNIQGGRGQTIYVDGINGGDGGGGGNFSGTTNMEAIAEVNVQMSAYTAEYGLKGGAQINFITKHGGSRYSGSAYTKQRHEAFNSTNYFNKKNDVPKPLYRYSNLGGTLGGPVPGSDKLFFFYSIDDTQGKNPQVLRRFTMPTALERQGDFSQTRTPSGSPITIRHPVTRQPFPDNKIPADMAHPAGLAYLNMLPMPNIDGDGYNFVDQEDSIEQPKRQHLLRVDFRPTDKDSLSVKGQTWYTNSVGVNVAGASARWGLIRQRYDFTADQGKIDYTRIINPSTVLEFSTGVFRSTENGPPENDQQLARIQRRTYPAINALPQFTTRHNPLGLIPEARWGNLQSASSNDYEPDIFFDNRWPITGEDSAFNASLNLTHTRGAHTLKAGLMRESEVFGQARSGVFSGEFSFAHSGSDPSGTGFAFANAYLGHVTSYTEDLGRAPNFRIQNTWAWYLQDTWKAHPKVTMDMGLRMYKWSHPYNGGGEASAFSFERFDPTWGGKPPVLFEPVRVGSSRRARNPLTGEIVPDTFIGLIVPGTGYSCGVITPESPCQINGIVVQEDPTYREGERGFVEPLPIQFDPRFGVAWAINPRTVLRAATGLFHDATGGPIFEGGPAYRFSRVTRFTDLNNYLAGASAVSPVGVSGYVRDALKRPSTHKYSIAVQRELGWNIVADVAYVGDYTRHLDDSFNFNAIPAGARFLPENRDLSRPDSSTVGLQPDKRDPGALPDNFLRPIRGFGDINISEPVNTARYDSLQVQLSRRFTGGFEMAGSYTRARMYTNNRQQGNPISGIVRDYNNNIQDHVFVLSYIVDLPGGGALLGDGWFARGLLNNWRLSGISTLATGSWTDVSASHSPSFDFAGGGDTCGNIIVTGDPNDGPRSEEQWFDTSVFERPSGRGDIGNSCGNHEIELPGFNNHDLTIFKDFRIRGNQVITFKAEVYNLFDSVQWDGVDTSAQFNLAGEQTDRNFGRVTSARTERRMAFSLRYAF